MSLRKKIFLINLLPIILISLNLRICITLVGPIVEPLREYYNLSATQVGFLTSLPLLAFGIISFLVAFFQPIKALFIGLILLIAGEIIRVSGGSETLFIGTGIMGAGIAVANVLLPSFIKAKFPRKIPKIMGLYSLTLNISAMLGIMLILPLTHFLTLPMAMGCWAILGLFALVSYYPQIANSRLKRTQAKASSQTSLFLQPSAWKITLFMAISSMMAYNFFAWYPSIIMSFGYDEHFASQMMLLSQCIIIPISYFVPVILGTLRKTHKTFIMGIICAIYAFVFILFSLPHPPTYQVWILTLCSILIGIPVGGAFSIAILFISTKSQNVRIATKLSSMAQGIGYLIASLGPLLIGWLHDKFYSFTPALYTLITLGILLCLLGLWANSTQQIALSNLKKS